MGVRRRLPRHLIRNEVDVDGLEITVVPEADASLVEVLPDPGHRNIRKRAAQSSRAARPIVPATSGNSDSAKALSASIRRAKRVAFRRDIQRVDDFIEDRMYQRMIPGSLIYVRQEKNSKPYPWPATAPEASPEHSNSSGCSTGQ